MIKIELEEVGPTDESPTTSYIYDANGNVTQIDVGYFDETGGSPDIFSTVYAYDSRNRATEIKQETETGWNITRFTYDGNGNQMRVETPLAVAGDEPDNIVEYVYDARDLPVRVTQANTLVTLMDYDAAGRLVRQVEGYGTPEARTWQYAYDGLGHLTLAIAPNGLETQYERNALGWVLEESVPGADRLLAQTIYHYDELGRVTMVEVLHKNAHDAAVGDGISKLEYLYTDAGNVSAEKIEGDIVSTYTYDTAMRIVSIKSSSNDVVAYTYDDNSNVVMVMETAVDTSGGSSESFFTHYVYDELNRLVGVEPDGDDVPDSTRETVYAYDSLNRLVTETDALGHVTRNEYDPLGRVISTTYDADGIGAAIAYTYDANGRLKTQSDANTNITSYAYDTLDRLRMITHPDGTTTQYTDYDVLGNLHTAVEPDGLVAHTDYDIMGRPVAQSFEHLAGRVDPGVTTWAYDALGRVIQAGNGVSTVTHTYDTLGNLQSETSEYGGDSRTINYQYDNRSLQKVLEVENSLRLDYTHDIVGRVRGIDQNALNIAGLEYLGGRMLQRNYGNGAGATVTYEPTGRRIEDITHTDVSAATVDTRTYAWDDVYNLDSYEITGGILTAPLVDYSYDGLNRNTAYGLDTAGNRSDYTMTGVDAAMNRYTTVGADTWYYSPWGGLQSIAQTKTYTYDAQNRLKQYTEITPGTTSSLGVLDPGQPDWTTVAGTWAWNAGGGYLEETGATTGCLLRTLPAAAPGLTVQYLSTHDPDDPDGDTDTGEFRTDDYPPKYYAQILLAVDTSAAPDYSYLALRIAPDQLALIEYDGTTLTELDTTDIECTQNVWHTLNASFEDNIVTVTCISEAAGEPMATLSGTSNLLVTLGNETDTVGFTVGELADYHFKALEYVTAPNTTINDMEWDYDPYWRKIARTEYDGAGAVLSQTRYVYDGWQLVQEIDALTDTVLAEYVYGPGYIDDVIQSSRGGNTYYHHTDQQYSTVAVTDVNGNVVERYGYDAFGTPAIYDGAGTLLTTGSGINNPVLYTGRTWQPKLGLYDYRNRQYDPTTGRFTTPDPIGAHGDWNNLGNAYTYVGNNPGKYVDPYGDIAETVWDATSLGIGLGSFGYNLWHGRFFDAGLDTIGIAADAAATAVPFIPGGAGIAIKGYRVAKVAQTLQHVDMAISVGQSVVAGGQAIYEGNTVGAGVAVLQTAIVGSRAAGEIASNSRIMEKLSDNTGAALNPFAKGSLRKASRETSVITDPARLLPGPSQGKLNAIRGNKFQRSANAALGVQKRNTTSLSGLTGSGKQINVEPDLLGGRFGVTEIRDRINISFTRQMQAEADIARQMDTSYNLIISPRTQSVSRPLQEAIRQSGGLIVQFDSELMKFAPVNFSQIHKHRILR